MRLRHIRRAGAIVALMTAMALAAVTVIAQADLEQEARVIEEMLIAPCCFSQQVSVHQSPAASEARRDIRARLAAGENRQQILDAYVAEYGTRELATPPAEGINLLLFVTPVVVLVSSIGLVFLAVRRLSGRRDAEPDGESPPEAAWTSDIAARLDDELEDLD
jgi:cytochrome c-type biogenesis protein CcmH/NrfF